MFSKVQKSVHEQIIQYGNYWSELQMVMRLVEESGELARAINIIYGPKKKKNISDGREIKEELSDVLYTIVAIANYNRLDLDKELGDIKNSNKEYVFKNENEPFIVTCGLNMHISKLFSHICKRTNNKPVSDTLALKKDILYIIKEVFIVARAFNIDIIYELSSKMNKDFEERLKDKVGNL